MTFDKGIYCLLLLVIPVLLLLGMSVIHWKKNMREKFAAEKFHTKLFGPIGNKHHKIQFILYIIALVVLVLGIMDLLSGYEKRKVKREGVDVIFAIDVSKSMDSKDVVPSRLDKAKNIVYQTVNKLGGDRVGLVFFAGEAYTMLPLTTDYESVKSSIQNVNTELIGTQGTNVEAALAESALSLQQKSASGKIIVLLSDGEDHEDGMGNAIDIANSYDIQIVSVGIGTEKGSPIPDIINGVEQGNIIDENGNVVISKREDDVLQELAQKTQGSYIIGNNTNTTSEKLINQFSKLKRNELGETFTYAAEHHFQWFIGFVLFIILILSFWNIKRNFLL